MKNLKQRVRELLNEWDPIHIIDEGERGIDDEYDGYIEGIIRLVKGGADKYKMKKHLEHTAKVNIGVSNLPKNTDENCRKGL